MNFINVLATISTYLPLTVDGLNFIGKFIEWLILITGSVGIGIILFTVALRLIVLPFDVYSKIKMKKNAVKMEEMRPELERLQKQYANDKTLYNQKMMALQKKNGYSALSGCLPMILSLVIFIIAINAFRQYSAVSMQNEFNSIVECYNASVKELTLDGEENQTLGIFVAAAVTEEEKENTLSNITIDDVRFFEHLADVYPASSYAGITSVLKKEGDDLAFRTDEAGVFTEEGAAECIEKLLAVDSFYSYRNYFEKDGERYKLVFTDITDPAAEEKTRENIRREIVNVAENDYLAKVIVPEVNERVKAEYNAKKGSISKSKFLWVKNIWMPDVSYEHPIPRDVKNFAQKISSALTRSCSCSRVNYSINKKMYDDVTAGLEAQKAQPNGYFIMVVLSILTMFLSQFVMQRMQKAQLELQTQDGQAAMTQKMMMWMMPIMFGFFAFSYSTAFSIYMTVSSVITTVSSVLINVIIEKRFAAKKAEIKAGRSRKDVNRIAKEKEEADEKARLKAEEKASKKKEKTESNTGKATGRPKKKEK